MTEGDIIQVAAHATNTAANGVWYAHILSSTQIALLVLVTHANSVGNGVGGATGTVQSQNLTPTYNEPSDGDAGSAASVNVALSALGDRTAWLSQRVGSYKTIFWGFAGPADQTEPPGTLFQVTSGAYTGGGLLTALTVATANFVAGDILVFRGQLNVSFGTGATGAGYVFKPQLFYNSSTNDFSTAPHIDVLNNETTSISVRTTVPMNWSYTLPAGTSFQGSLAVVINARQTLGSNTATVYNSSTFELRVIRAN